RKNVEARTIDYVKIQRELEVNPDADRNRLELERRLKVLDGYKDFYEGGSEIGHFVLDVGGIVPVIGEPLDLLNAAWYATEGNYGMATLSAISIVPVAGDYLGKGGKLIIKSGVFEAAVQKQNNLAHFVFKNSNNKVPDMEVIA